MPVYRASQRAILAISACLTAGLVVAGQRPSAEWKQQNDKINRYEGIGVPKNVGADTPVLIGFYAAPDSLDLSKDKDLTVSFFVWQEGPYRLTAREVSLSLYYWMEPRSPVMGRRGLNTFSGWKTTDVLQPKSIDPNSLAVLVAGQSGGMVAPAVLRGTPTRLPEHIESYRAIFVSEIPLSDASFQIFKGCDGLVNGTLNDGGRLGRKYPGLAFAVPFSLSTATSQLVTLRLNYRVGNTDPPPLDYCFFHVPNPSAPLVEVGAR